MGGAKYVSLSTDNTALTPDATRSDFIYKKKTVRNEKYLQLDRYHARLDHSFRLRLNYLLVLLFLDLSNYFKIKL